VPVAGAGLMAVMCGGVGVSAAWGLHRGMMLIPLFLACVMIAPPVWGSVPVDRNATDYLVWAMVIWGGGALWAALVFPLLLRKMKPVPREPNTRGDTIVYTTIITVLCTLSTLAVLIWRPGSNGAWLIVTLLVITEVGHVDTLKRTTSRVVGTVVGVAVAAVVASLTTNQTALIGIGLVLMVIGLVIRIGPRYWLYMAFMTPAIVLFSSTSGAGVEITDAQRLLDTLVGAALVLLASAITVWCGGHGISKPTPSTRPRSAVTIASRPQPEPTPTIHSRPQGSLERRAPLGLIPMAVGNTPGWGKRGWPWRDRDAVLRICPRPGCAGGRPWCWPGRRWSG